MKLRSAFWVMPALMGLMGCGLSEFDDSFHKCKMEGDASLAGNFTTTIFDYTPPESDADRYRDGYCPSGLTCFPVQGKDNIYACSECSGVWQLKCGECMDVRKDPDNCGACGNQCAKDQKCVDGKCIDEKSCADTCKDSKTLRQCQADGSQKNVTCEHGCADGACKKEVCPEKDSCKDEKVLLKCQMDKNGKRTILEEECPYGCQDGECAACRNTCDEKGKILIECEDDGSTKEVVCPYACRDGACSDSCTESICKDIMNLWVCDGGTISKEVFCELGCKDGACCDEDKCSETPECVFDTCSEDEHTSHGTCSGAAIDRTCTDGCIDGQCVGDRPGDACKTTRCVGDNLVKCDEESRKVSEVVSCPVGCNKSKKVCSIDSDGDGVIDEKDACPYNPNAQTESATKCWESLLDDDLNYHVYHAQNLKSRESVNFFLQFLPNIVVIFHSDINLAEINAPEFPSECDPKLLGSPFQFKKATLKSSDDEQKNIRYEVNGERCTLGHKLFEGSITTNNVVIDVDEME